MYFPVILYIAFSELVVIFCVAIFLKLRNTIKVAILKQIWNLENLNGQSPHPTLHPPTLFLVFALKLIIFAQCIDSVPVFFFYPRYVATIPNYRNLCLFFLFDLFNDIKFVTLRNIYESQFGNIRFNVVLKEGKQDEKTIYSFCHLCYVRFL